MLRKLQVFCLLPFFLYACRQSETNKIKQYQIFIENAEEADFANFSILIERYHEKIGLSPLSLVRTREEANSFIHLKKGLNSDAHQTIGLGRWLKKTDSKTKMGLLGSQEESTEVYGMDLSFDLSNYQEYSKNLTDANDVGSKHLLHLFCHEVGHGMQLDHSLDPGQIMFEVVPVYPKQKLDWQTYIAQIQNFLRDQ